MQIRIISIKIVPDSIIIWNSLKAEPSKSHLNKFILQKDICRNSKPTVLFCFWKVYQCYSYKAITVKCRLFYYLYVCNNTSTPFCAYGQNEDV